MASLTIPARSSSAQVMTARRAAVRAAGERPAGVRPVAATGTVRPRAARPGVRLTRRGRRLVRSVVLLAAVLLALVGFVAGQGAVSSAGAADGGPATTQVVVQPGDTLWAIAAATLPDDDTREAVRRIADLNNIDPGVPLVPGQPLVLPVVG